jgi:C4-dicarboxylate-specific signal transduction histidine kinase
MGIQSFMAVPLTVGGATVGAITLSSYRRERDWPAPLAQRLRLLGELFANAIARQRGQEELRRLRNELAHVARIVTMGTIATSIAHEVNQPLCAILSNAQSSVRLLAKSRGVPAQAREALQDIASDARRASEVVERIRAMGKRDTRQSEPLVLSEVTREVLPLVRDELIRRDVSLDMSFAEALPPVTGDRVQLQQVILNLIVNGAEAMESVRAGSRRLKLSTACEGETVTMRIEDTGPGLDASLFDQVFDAFFTTKPHGMGLGLAISRSIIRGHGGNLWATRNIGPGTTFHIALPVMQAGAR